MAVPHRSATRLLLIEDNLSVATATRRMLKSHAVEVVFAADVAAADVALRDERIDLVLCDFHLTDGTAFDVRALMRATGLGVPFIVTSGKDLTETELVTLGVAGFLRKPFAPTELVAIVARTALARQG